MTNKKLLKLLEKYKSHTLTDKERKELTAWLDTKAGEKALWKLWDEDFRDQPLNKASLDQEKVFKSLQAKIPSSKGSKELRLLSTKRIIQTAAALLLFASASLWYYYNDAIMNQFSPAIASEEVIPGKNQAILILESGESIELGPGTPSGSQSTTLEGFTIDEFGVLNYATAKAGDHEQLTYNTIITPRGGEYKVVLSDGTVVWLNAESQLRYPVQFAGQERRVELKGEAYFEVTHKRESPFKVEMEKQSIEVLGTSFNVKSYNDQITTTLVSGSVALQHEGINETAILRPSQQAKYNSKENKLSIETVDTFYDTAWISGNFAFYKTSIHQAMEEISRWYDVEIIYESGAPNKFFSGTISRFESLQELLETIEMTGSVKFKLNGRRVSVMD